METLDYTTLKKTLNYSLAQESQVKTRTTRGGCFFHLARQHVHHFKQDFSRISKISKIFQRATGIVCIVCRFFVFITVDIDKIKVFKNDATISF